MKFFQVKEDCIIELTGIIIRKNDTFNRISFSRDNFYMEVQFDSKEERDAMWADVQALLRQ